MLFNGLAGQFGSLCPRRRDAGQLAIIASQMQASNIVLRAVIIRGSKVLSPAYESAVVRDCHGDVLGK